MRSVCNFPIPILKLSSILMLEFVHFYSLNKLQYIFLINTHMDETLVSDQDKNTGTLDLGKKHEGFFLSWMQDVSFVLGTKDYQLLLEQIAQKCDVHFCLLPSISSLENDLQNEEEMEDSVSFDKLLAKVQMISSALEGDQSALIVYTSGTTGKPKGVVHTHASIGSQVRMLSKAWDYSSSDRVLHCLPLHHILHQSKRFLYRHNGKHSCV
jgi:acyl-CoA synthetase (AMP-forming)/AMP-acid ligase II